MEAADAKVHEVYDTPIVHYAINRIAHSTAQDQTPGNCMKHRQRGRTHEIQDQHEKPEGRKHLTQHDSEFFGEVITQVEERSPVLGIC